MTLAAESHCCPIGSVAQETTAVGMLGFQGRDLRVLFDSDAPPVCCSTAVVDHTPSLELVSCGRVAPPVGTA